MIDSTRTPRPRSTGGDRRGRRFHSRTGLSILEVLIAFVALMGGLLGFARAIISTMAASSTSHEAAIAREAARMQLEELRAQDFSEVFALYNDDPADDPDGAGTGPGSGFAVEGLDAPDGDADGLAGVLLFPANDAAPGVLREDFVSRGMGMPRDLDGDGVIDANDHTDDHLLLPVIARVEWRMGSGSGQVELHTMLGNLR